MLNAFDPRKCAISLSDRRGREGITPIWNALRLEKKKLRTYEMLPNMLEIKALAVGNQCIVGHVVHCLNLCTCGFNLGRLWLEQLSWTVIGSFYFCTDEDTECLHLLYPILTFRRVDFYSADILQVWRKWKFVGSFHFSSFPNLVSAILFNACVLQKFVLWGVILRGVWRDRDPNDIVLKLGRSRPLLHTQAQNIVSEF